MTIEQIGFIVAVILWLAIPTVIVAIEFWAARLVYGFYRPIRGAPGSRLLRIITFGIFGGAIAQSLAVLNAYRLVVLGGTNTGGVLVTLLLYFASQIIIGGVITWAAWTIRSVMKANTNEARITIDATSTVQFASAGVTALFGYQPAEIIGRSLTMLMAPQYRAPHEAAVHRYVETHQRTLDWERVDGIGQRKDGSQFPVVVTLSEQSQEGQPLFTGTIRVAQ